MNREGNVELTLWKDGRPITRPVQQQFRTDPNWSFNTCLPGLSPDLPEYTLVQVEMRHLMPIGTDWQLVNVHTTINCNNLGYQNLALRFAADPDEWPTAVQPLIVPFFDTGNWASTRFETWYMTLRGCGAKDIQK